jgi:outer membrane protein assembly factor BamA
MRSLVSPSSLAAFLGLLLAVLAAAGIAGCATSGVRPTGPGAVRVESIEIEGNEELDDDDLREGLALDRLRQSGQELDPYLVPRDGERLRGVYLRRGFFRVKVEPDVVQHAGRAEVRYRIVEGPRATLAGVEIVGLPEEVPPDEVRDLIPLDDGDPFVYEVYQRAKPAVLKRVMDAGYAHARLEATVAADRVRDEAIIRLELHPGKRARFGVIDLRGVDGDLADAARARLAAKQGAIYSSSALVDSQDALYDMGRFASVRVDAEPGDATVVPVTVSVTPAPPNEVRLGGGVGMNPTAYEVRGRSSYRKAAWPWPLTTSFLELRPAYVLMRDDDEPQPRVEATAAIERMDLFRPFLTAEAAVSFSYLAMEAYTSVGPRTRLGLRTPIIRRYLSAGVGWQYSLLDFSRIDEAVDDATRMELGLDDGAYRLGFYEQSVVLDLRDDPVEPRLGGYAEVRVEEGTRAAGGELDYLRVTPEVRGFLPLGPIVVAGRGRLGAIRGDLPVTQRYFAGGATSQRGFAERHLAPTATRELDDGTTASAVIGGGALLESGLEVRFPLGTIKKLAIGGVGFLDGADVVERYGDLDAGRLHWAAGGGLRVATPIGPLRLDLGVRLNRLGPTGPAPGDRFALHLSLGEAF